VGLGEIGGLLSVTADFDRSEVGGRLTANPICATISVSFVMYLGANPWRTSACLGGAADSELHRAIWC
jgi:hypothetical protein